MREGFYSLAASNIEGNKRRTRSLNIAFNEL